MVRMVSNILKFCQFMISRLVKLGARLVVEVNRLWRVISNMHRQKILFCWLLENELSCWFMSPVVRLNWLL